MSINKKIVIFGTGYIGQVFKFHLEQANLEVVSFCEEKKYIKDDIFCSIPLVALETLTKIYSPTNHLMMVSIGYKSHNRIRENRFLQLKELGYNFFKYIDKNASFYETPVGENTFIFENNVVQPFTSIGCNNIIWSGNHIGHHSTIKDNCFIASHVVISGNCTIENNCFLGVNCTIADGVTIGAHSVIGAGATVTKNVPENSLVVPEKSKIINLKRDII